MQSAADLRSLLNRIDHRGYPAYKDTKGTYRFPGYVLSIDHVQGDPFASPSKVSIHVEGKAAAFPSDLYCGKDQRIALQDELTRQFAKKADQFAFQAKGSGKSGMIAVSRCGQEVLERTACRLDPNSGDIILRMEIGFPANGRTINARELEKILFQFVPECVKASLFYKNADAARLRKIIDLAEDQRYIRDQLPKLGLCAFVANGSILPRESGVSSKPMRGAVKFQSPKEQEVTITLPHAGVISGMGIKRGITLIVGGGYHGKSTLLKALETGVYPHVAGDGREYVITDDTAVKIRAEDGRSIKKTDISMFINALPVPFSVKPDFPPALPDVGFLLQFFCMRPEAFSNSIFFAQAGSHILQAGLPPVFHLPENTFLQKALFLLFQIVRELPDIFPVPPLSFAPLHHGSFSPLLLSFHRLRLRKFSPYADDAPTRTQDTENLP